MIVYTIKMMNNKIRKRGKKQPAKRKKIYVRFCDNNFDYFRKTLTVLAPSVL